MANAERLSLVLPAGRLISGSLTDLVAVDHEGTPIPENERSARMIGVAVRKDAPGINELIGAIYSHALKGYSNNAAVQGVIGQGFNGSFSWKIKDGDLPNKKTGRVGEHSAGCWIFYMSQHLDSPIRACTSQNVDLDPKEVKRGYYVDVSIAVLVNEKTGDRAGIYINPSIVRLLGYGPEIFPGPDAATAFANAPAQLPPGASAVPVASTSAGAPGGGMPGTGGGAPQTNGLPGVAPQSQGSGMPGTVPGVAPHYGFVAGPGGMPGVGNG